VQIIAEIIQNKSQYSFKTAEDYVENTDRAFDKILEEVYGKTNLEIEEAREQMQKRMAELEKSAANRTEEEATIRSVAEREKTIVAISKKKAEDAVRRYRAISEFGWVAYVIAGITLLFGLATWIWEIQPIYTWVLNALPGKIKASFSQFMEVWGVFTLVVGLLSVGIKGAISNLGSETREKKLYEKYYRENTEAVKPK